MPHELFRHAPEKKPDHVLEVGEAALDHETADRLLPEQFLGAEREGASGSGASFQGE